MGDVFDCWYESGMACVVQQPTNIFQPFDFITEKIRNKYQAGIIYLRMPWKAHLMINNTSRYVETQKYKRHPFLKVAFSYIF